MPLLKKKAGFCARRIGVVQAFRWLVKPVSTTDRFVPSLKQARNALDLALVRRGKAQAAPRTSPQTLGGALFGELRIVAVRRMQVKDGGLGAGAERHALFFFAVKHQLAAGDHPGEVVGFGGIV